MGQSGIKGLRAFRAGLRAAVWWGADEAVVSPEERILDCDRVPACTDKEGEHVEGRVPRRQHCWYAPETPMHSTKA